jgi:ubiquinone biosynthesis monooxygenase Coq7
LQSNAVLSPDSALYNESMEPDRLLDPLIGAFDRALRAVFAPAHADRPVPGPSVVPELSESERRHSAALMRVNHAGEVAAQALYHGQAFAARGGATHDFLVKAAREETDHLAWCETRLAELGSRPSLLNPLWYVGSFTIGVLAAALGDRASLGFVSETERQVEGHLSSHLERLPASDTRSRAIVEAMRTDEVAHGAQALAAGGGPLPAPVRTLMRTVSGFMTGTAYWV